MMPKLPRAFRSRSALATLMLCAALASLWTLAGRKVWKEREDTLARASVDIRNLTHSLAQIAGQDHDAEATTGIPFPERARHADAVRRAGEPVDSRRPQGVEGARGHARPRVRRYSQPDPLP